MSGSVAAGDLSHRYLWGPVVDQLFGDERVKSLSSAGQNELFWALTDRQGSVTALVDDATGGLRLHRTFDSFGNIVDETHYGSDAYGYSYVVTENDLEYVDEAFAYTGRLLDAATGLQNNQNRWYDAGVGRWLSEDPIGFNAGDANLYRYVGNGPVNATDPSGLWTFGFGFGLDVSYPPWPPFFNGHISGSIDVTIGWDPRCGLSLGGSATGGLGPGPGIGAGAGPHFSITTAPYVQQLTGAGTSTGFWTMFGGGAVQQPSGGFWPFKPPQWIGGQISLPNSAPSIGGGCFLDATYTIMPVSIGGPRPWYWYMWPPNWF